MKFLICSVVFLSFSIVAQADLVDSMVNVDEEAPIESIEFKISFTKKIVSDDLPFDLFQDVELSATPIIFGESVFRFAYTNETAHNVCKKLGYKGFDDSITHYGRGLGKRTAKLDTDFKISFGREPATIINLGCLK